MLHDITLSLRGLTLLTGTTGSGKSTTLAAMVDLINNSFRCKIITIEDPVEYVHTIQKAMISQLEVGQDTPSFEHGLRQALREDPDVILVGELRDSETMRMALRARTPATRFSPRCTARMRPRRSSESWRWCLPRNVRSPRRNWPAHSRPSSRSAWRSRSTATSAPAMEILRGGPVTSKYIMENRLSDLSDYIGSREGGMQRFDQHLLDLYHQKIISGTEAFGCRPTPRPSRSACAEYTKKGWTLFPEWRSDLP